MEPVLDVGSLAGLGRAVSVSMENLGSDSGMSPDEGRVDGGDWDFDDEDGEWEWFDEEASAMAGIGAEFEVSWGIRGLGGFDLD